MKKRLEFFRRLSERLTYINRVVLAIFGLGTLIKLAEMLTLIDPVLEKKVMLKTKEELLLLSWLAGMLAYIVTSEAIVQVKSKIRTLEEKIDQNKNPSKFRRSLKRSKGVAPPRS